MAWRSKLSNGLTNSKSDLDDQDGGKAAFSIVASSQRRYGLQRESKPGLNAVEETVDAGDMISRD